MPQMSTDPTDPAGPTGGGALFGGVVSTMDTDADEQVVKEIAGLSPGRLALRRLLHDKLTMVSAVISAIFVLLAVLSPLLVSVGILDPLTNHKDLLDPARGFLPKGDWGGMSWAHPLGVEPGIGRDLLSRILLGVTTSLTIALSAALIAVVLGTVLGIISGYLGGPIDFWINRLIDMTLSFPQTLMLLALSGMLTEVLITVLHVPRGDIANGLYIILVLGLFGWPSMARIIRGLVFSQREREYVEAARSLGASKRRIWFTELLPNLWAPILVYGTLLLPAYVSAEAALSFLSVGVKPPTPTLGNVLTDSISYPRSDFTFFFFPALFIAVIVMSFNLLGDGLRDALDPKGDR
jgi:peptide/nickel transport system permease protein